MVTIFNATSIHTFWHAASEVPGWLKILSRTLRETSDLNWIPDSTTQTNEYTRTVLFAADHIVGNCLLLSKSAHKPCPSRHQCCLLVAYAESGEWWHPAVRRWLFFHATYIHRLNNVKSNEQRTSWACPWHPPTLLGSQGSTLTSASGFPRVYFLGDQWAHQHFPRNFIDFYQSPGQIPRCYWIPFPFCSQNRSRSLDGANSQRSKRTHRSINSSLVKSYKIRSEKAI